MTIVYYIGMEKRERGQKRIVKINKQTIASSLKTTHRRINTAVKFLLSILAYLIGCVFFYYISRCNKLPDLELIKHIQSTPFGSLISNLLSNVFNAVSFLPDLSVVVAIFATLSLTTATLLICVACCSEDKSVECGTVSHDHENRFVKCGVESRIFSYQQKVQFIS